MATPAESAQATQAGLVIAMGRQVDMAWHQLNPADLESTLPKFKLLMAALVRKYGQASGALATRFYSEQRREAEVFTRFTPSSADPADVEQVNKAIGWSTRGLWQPQPNVQGSKAQTVGAAEKMILDVGRQTIIQSVHADPKTVAWARVTEPDPCYFCAMLASRGAVYKENTVGFQAHDHCRCHVEPVFVSYEPPARVRQWQAEWRDVTKGQSNQLLAWRQHFENRSPAATTTTPGGST